MPDADDSSGRHGRADDRTSRRLQRRRRAGVQRGSSLKLKAAHTLLAVFEERLRAVAQQRKQEARRDRMFTRFHRCQMRREHFYPLIKLVELYADAFRPPTPEAREALQHRAYTDLTWAILAGRMPVLFLDLERGARRLTYRELRQRLDDQTAEDPQEVFRTIISQCWTTYAVARAWAAGHGLTLPDRVADRPSAASPADAPTATPAGQPPAASSPDTPSTPTPSDGLTAEQAAMPSSGDPTLTPAPATSPPDPFKACIKCLQDIAAASPEYRTHTRPELKRLCKGKLGEETWREALREAFDALPEDSAWRAKGKRGKP
ncbi:MAG: hypothetical protein ACJ8AI_20250 [Rhodopila sp.]